ncbi:MAG: hypothetical protein Q7S83_02415 [bacterium]|nr:hypothetical protein [bacterium]
MEQNFILIQDGKKKIYEIPEEDIGKFKLLGSAGGFSIGFCLYIGSKHSENFLDRVCGYRIEKNGFGEMMNEAARQAGLPARHQENITVSFYEEKTNN